jgi:predicted Holliday junction resolvase-like endonuclease
MNNRQELIAHLPTLNLTSECPCCGKDIRLDDAIVFDPSGDMPTEAKLALELKRSRLQEEAETLKLEREKLRKKKLTSTDGAEKKAMDVNVGLTAEKVVTGWDSFPHNPCDCSYLGDPIDYLVFEGLHSSDDISSIAFLDIKTGNARLSKRQRMIVDAIEDHRVKALEI